jgi:citrate synthase
VAEGEDADRVVLELAREIRESGGKAPGFGHPVHRPLDPRAERMLELADQRGVSGPHVDLARRMREAVAQVWGKPLVMNVSMPIAAVLLDVDFPPAIIKAIPLLARTGGILAHLAEEQQNPIGFVLAGHAEAAVSLRRQGRD